MPLYYATITYNNQRAVIAIDHVLAEYGISEQEYISTWFAERPEIQGNGDTVQEALDKLFLNLSRTTWLGDPGDDTRRIRHEFYKCVKSSRASFAQWRTPIIGNRRG